MPKARWLVVAALAAGFVAARGARSDDAVVPAEPASVARARAHYERVLEELRAADTTALDAAQRAARATAIEHLQAYCEREDYPVNTDDPASNLPYYRDDAGRRCAVATLLHELGAAPLVERMAQSANHAFVSTLSGDAEFEAWLERNGLSLAETVRIMAPAVQGTDIGAAANPSSSGGTTTSEPTPTWDTSTPQSPGPTPGGGPITPGGETGGPTTGGRSPGGPGGGPTTGGGGVGGPLTGSGLRGRGGAGRETRSELGADAWALWWEFSKTEFYAPNTLVLAGDPSALTGAATPEAVQRALRADARRAAEPLVLAALDAPEPEVRMAAAAAYARIARRGAVARLTDLMRDPSAAVRERALLALGATGAPEARELLLAIARDGTEITPAARALAHVALAIGVRHGMEPCTDELLERFAEYREQRDETLEVATIFHWDIARDVQLGNAFHPLHTDESAQPLRVRGRTLEALPAISVDPKSVFEVLQRYLNGRSLELRRSAAASLGALEQELVLPQLMTAYELEVEPVTRGLMLLSIARRGGPTARDFLLHELRRGKDREMRPWTMLALGVLARDADDAEVREALRSAALPRAVRSARSLALGLARDAESIPQLAEEVADASQPWDRARAAYALALIGGEDARTALRGVVWRERSTFVRALEAFALGTFGNAEDAPFIVQAARETSDADMVAPCAVGVRYHGTQQVFDLTRSHASDPTVAALGRATLVEALGLLLDDARPMGTAALYRRANFGLLPAWANAAYKSTF